MADDLHAPLGQGRHPGRATGRLRPGLAAASIVLLAGGLWVWKTSSPSLPGSVAKIEAVAPPPVAPVEMAATKAEATPSDDDTTGGITIVRPPGAAAPPGAFIKVPQDLSVTLQPAPDMRLVEKSRFGLLPQRSADGVRPADAYARPVETESRLPRTAPRVAIVVGGMGLNPALTAAAVSALPPAVTLGFAPYGDDLGRQVRTAREAGHEAILQVPMEGFGDPPEASSHLLMAGSEPRELLDQLHWHMGRFTGYVALAGFMGGKFTADEAALGPVLRDTAGRGLFYFDDGTSARSRVPALASSFALPLVRADVVIDAAPDSAAMDAALKKLEARARDRGFAVGFASGLPPAVERIAAFSKSLADRGVALVPASAFAALQTGTTGKIARP